MNLQERVQGIGRVRQARWTSWRVPSIAAILGGLLACNAYADNTQKQVYIWETKHNVDCGGSCSGAEVNLALIVTPGDCIPSCTVTPKISSLGGLCAPIATVMMHIDAGVPGDQCADADIGRFPINLQDPSFVFSSAEFADFVAGIYTAHVELKSCAGTGLVCTTNTDCSPGDTCVLSDTLRPPDAPPIKTVINLPTLSEWGVAVMTILLLSAGTIVFRRQGAHAI